MSHVLLVEDDPILARGLVVNLELEGYRVTWARDLASADRFNQSGAFQLVVLDLGLPDGNGLDFCAKLRKGGSRIPIIILTAQTDEDSVVNGLQAGANDYVRKPFGNRELMARIKTALREPLRREAQMRFGDLLMLTDQRKALYRDKELELNRREFDVLSYLVEHADAVVTRDALLAALDKQGEIYDRTMDSHISHIRSKMRGIGADSIQISSIYGVGYRLEKK